jgi:AcrR family transcriptional regulator
VPARRIQQLAAPRWAIFFMSKISTKKRPSRTAPTAANRRGERRQAIVAAATRLFAEVGYAQCEMDRVATDLGVAKGTLYLYFPSKEELFYACVDSGMKELQEAVQQATADLTDRLDRIRRGIYAYLKFFDEHPDLIELFIQERARFKDRKRPTYFEHRDLNRGPWRDLYSSLIDDGRLRNDVAVERMLDTVGNLLYGTMFTNHFLNRAVPLTDQYEALMEVLFRGILSERERKH